MVTAAFCCLPNVWQIARGSWELCETRSEDVLLADDSMWQRLQASGRLIDPSGIDDDEAP